MGSAVILALIWRQLGHIAHADEEATLAAGDGRSRVDGCMAMAAHSRHCCPDACSPRCPTASWSPTRTPWRSTASTGRGTRAPAHPLAVVRAEDAAQVQTAVRWAAEHGVPVVPRGAGSGLSGGSTAVDGGIVLSLERMRAIEVDAACQVAVVEPGALNAEVKAAAAEHGLWYPPDPSSYEICSIGGNVATNAGGLCCVKYGVTTDYVLGLDVVLADGTLVTPRRARGSRTWPGCRCSSSSSAARAPSASSPGPILRLVPAQAAGATLVASFPTVTAAAEAVVAIRGRLRPSMLELMDRPSINAVEDCRPMGLDPDAGALLMAQSDAPGTSARRRSTIMRAGLRGRRRDRGVRHRGRRRGRALRAGPAAWRFPRVERPRRAAARGRRGAGAAAAGAGRRGRRGSPPSDDVRIPVVAHAGDGNTHPLIVVRPRRRRRPARAAAAFDEIMDAAIGLGGTITGEHGVGRTKKAALPAQLGADVMALTRRVKDALDPSGILNPARSSSGGSSRPASRSAERRLTTRSVSRTVASPVRLRGCRDRHSRPRLRREPGEQPVVPEEPDPEGVQVLRVLDDAAARARHHLHRRAQRLRQVQRRRRPRLGDGRAGRQEPARRQDGGRHLRRHLRAARRWAAPRCC